MNPCANMTETIQSRRQFLKALAAGAATLALPHRSISAGVASLHAVKGSSAPALAFPEPASGPPAEDSPRPNIVLIMTDDQGYGDLGATGNPVIKTPHIDALAAQSAAMSNFYVSPVCAPTRACLMTGRYNYRTRAIDTFVGRAMMDPEETTLAELLRDAGYETGIFGKWHLGDNYPLRPTEQGFAESLVHRGGGIGQPSDPPGGEGKYTDPILAHNGELKPFKGYCTDVYFDHALAWIEKSAAAGRNFFAYIPTNAPHGPFDDVPNELLEQYKQMDLANDRFPQDKGHKLPQNANLDTHARIFAMITNIDQNVGRLLNKLDALNLADNTIVIFMVDNGPNTRRYVAGFKGNKSDVHEGGIRSPFFIRWPRALKSGRTSDRIAAHIDLLPTLLEACNVQKPDDLKLDGRSLLPLLSGRDDDWPDRMIVIQSHRGDKPVLYHHFAARTQQWKLLNASGFNREQLTGEPKFELYDMAADPYETNDVAAQHPDIVQDLKTRYEAWFKDVSSTRPDNYAPPRIHIGTPHENPTTLTRQDWRHVKGSPWAGDSNGYWELYAARTAEYDIHLRFPALPADATVILDLSGRKLESPAQKGRTEYTFKSVGIEEGNLRLTAAIKTDNDTKGPHQIDILCR